MAIVEVDLDVIVDALPGKLKALAILATETLPLKEFRVTSGTLTNTSTGETYPGFSLEQRGKNVELGYANKFCIAEVEDDLILLANFQDGNPPYIDSLRSEKTTIEDIVGIIHIAMIPREFVS